MLVPHFISIKKMKRPNSPVMKNDTDIPEAMTSLSMFKKLLMIRDCEHPKKLKKHIKYWSTKVENLTNYSLENEKDRKYVAMFQKLVEFARARLEYARDKLEGWTDVSDTRSPNTKMEA